MNCGAAVEVVGPFSELDCLRGKASGGFELRLGGGDHRSHRPPQQSGHPGRRRAACARRAASTRSASSNLPCSQSASARSLALRRQRPAVHRASLQVVAQRRAEIASAASASPARSSTSPRLHRIATGDAGALSEVPEVDLVGLEELLALVRNRRAARAGRRGMRRCWPPAQIGHGSSCRSCSQRSIASATGVGPSRARPQSRPGRSRLASAALVVAREHVPLPRDVPRGATRRSLAQSRRTATPGRASADPRQISKTGIGLGCDVEELVRRLSGLAWQIGRTRARSSPAARCDDRRSPPRRRSLQPERASARSASPVAQSAMLSSQSNRSRRSVARRQERRRALEQVRPSRACLLA